MSARNRLCAALVGVAAAAVSAGPGLAAEAPAIESWQTDNGARVLYVEVDQLPMVDIQVTFDAGAARDGDHPGLARLTNRLLSSGAGGLDADAVAERFESVGARQSSSSARDMALVSLRSLTDDERLGPAMDMLAKIIAEPDFPEGDLERERSRMLTSVRSRQQAPDELAQVALYEALYGDHPYAAPPGGTREALEGIDRADVTAFHERYYVGRNAVVAIVGDVDRARAEELAERAVGRLPEGEPAPTLPDVPDLDGPRTIHVEFPSSQSHVLIGQPAIDRHHPDRFPLVVGNHVLGGGGFGSRLTDEVRERRGLSYSVYSALTPMRARGPFRIGLITSEEQLEEAVTVARRVLAEFIADGPAADELEQSRQNIVGSFPLRLDSNSSIVGELASLGFYGLPLDYLETYRERVRAVTGDDVRDAVRALIDPDRMVTVVVGRSGLEDEGE